MISKLLAAVFLLAASTAPAGAADYKILIATWRGCEEACRGFQDHLADAGVDADYIIEDAAQNEDAIASIVARARATAPDLILTWGTNVTVGVAGTVDDLDDPAFNHDIPHVFMIVADPVGAGVVESLDVTGRPNVTGTYNRMPEEVTVRTIRSYKPDFQHLGLVYHVNEKNSVLKRDEMAALAERLDFRFTSAELPLGADGTPDAALIPAAVEELKQQGVDFIYLGSSSFLQEHADAFTGAAVENGLPVLSPYEQLVRESQALLSVSARYYDVGRLAGEQAEKILVEGVAPGELPVARMTDFAVVINVAVAKRLNQFPPLDLVQIAETVN